MAVTILDLAEYRWRQRGEEVPEQPNGADFERVGLALLGGCQQCEAAIAAYHGYPTTTGFWRCARCVGPTGYETVEEANFAIFGNDDKEDHDAPSTA